MLLFGCFLDKRSNLKISLWANSRWKTNFDSYHIDKIIHKNSSSELKKHSPYLRWSHKWLMVWNSKHNKGEWLTDSGESDAVGQRWCLLDRSEGGGGGDDDEDVNKNTREIKPISWRWKVAGEKKRVKAQCESRTKDKLVSGGWKGLFNEGWKGASHGWRGRRERAEEKREGGSAEIHVLCNSDFCVGSDIKMAD